jgi:hypothetical protein
VTVEDFRTELAELVLGKFGKYGANLDPVAMAVKLTYYAGYILKIHDEKYMDHPVTEALGQAANALGDVADPQT